MKSFENKDFLEDVYHSLITSSDTRIRAFLNSERETAAEDAEFFKKLLSSYGELSQKAAEKIPKSVFALESFLNSYKRLAGDESVFRVFLNRDTLDSLFTLNTLREMMGEAEQGILERFWTDDCRSSAKNLYYHIVLSDSSGPPFLSKIKPKLKLRIFNILLDFKALMDSAVKNLENFGPELFFFEELSPFQNIGKNGPLLSYFYNNLASEDYPEAIRCLSPLKHNLRDEEFYEQLLRMNLEEACNRFSVPKQVAKDICVVSGMLHRLIDHPKALKVFEAGSNLDALSNRIDNLMIEEETRAYNSYKRFMEHCKNSMLNFYLRIITSDPKTIKFSGLNPDKSRHLFEILREIAKEIEAFAETLSSSYYPKLTTALTKLDFNSEQQGKLLRSYKRNGHFPLFKAVSFLLMRMDVRSREIISQSINIEQGTQLYSTSELASKLGLSTERVRQLRENCFLELLAIPKRIAQTVELHSYHHIPRRNRNFDTIRKEEGVNFSDEYISACISVVDSSVTIVGDLRKAILLPHGNISPVYLVSKNLAECFDFEKFIAFFEFKLREKRFSPNEQDLGSMVFPFTKRQLSSEEYQGVLKECIYMLLRTFPELIKGRKVIFPTTAHKLLPELIEDIIRDCGRPMNAQEIAEQLHSKYPKIKQEIYNIGANALRNENISAISRTGVYTLKEWKDDKKRGGTIREIAKEYLNSLEKPIAPLSEICDYLRKYRDNIQELSVQQNLLLDTKQKYNLYYKGYEKYIGMQGFEYGPDFTNSHPRKLRSKANKHLPGLWDEIEAK